MQRIVLFLVLAAAVPSHAAAVEPAPPAGARLIDVDFDGVLDAVRRRDCMGSCYFDIWLRVGDRFVHSPALSALSSPILHKDTNTITSYDPAGLGGALYSTETYEIHNGVLELVQFSEQRDELRGSTTFRRTISEVHAGSHHLVCSALVELRHDKWEIIRVDVGAPSSCVDAREGEWL